MNGAEIHLALNHTPLFTLGIGILVFLYGMLRKNTDVIRAALFIFVLGSLITIPVYLTGDPAEHVVKNIEGVDKTRIEAHDEAATTAFIVIGLAGLASLAGLWLLRTQPSLTKLVTISILGLAILALITVAYATTLGGRIHHPESRPGFVAPAGHGD